MYSILIKNFVAKLTHEDIVSFSKNNNITLTNNEVNYLYNTIKKDYQLILNGDKIVFDNLKNNISSNNYDRIISLYNHYKSVYNI